MLFAPVPLSGRAQRGNDERLQFLTHAMPLTANRRTIRAGKRMSTTGSQFDLSDAQDMTHLVEQTLGLRSGSGVDTNRCMLGIFLLSPRHTPRHKQA